LRRSLPSSRMEISGTVFRPVSYVSGAGTHTRSRSLAPRATVRMGTGSDFCDEGHLQYYQNTKKVLSPKKKLKLLKDFSKLGFASDPQKLSMFYDLQQNLTSVQIFSLFILLLLRIMMILSLVCSPIVMIDDDNDNINSNMFYYNLIYI